MFSQSGRKKVEPELLNVMVWLLGNSIWRASVSNVSNLLSQALLGTDLRRVPLRDGSSDHFHAGRGGTLAFAHPWPVPSFFVH